MEDLTEEPELEEREEEEEEEEEEENAREPKTDECKDESQECQRDQAEEDENQEDASNDQVDELLIRPVRNVARRASLSNESGPIDDAQGLLETNFSVTGLNEIKTERITPTTNSNAFGGDAPKRPMSLDLNAPIAFRKLHGAARPEKFRARLIDQSMLMK